MRVAIVANTRKEGARTLVPRFLDILTAAGIEAVVDSELGDMVGDSVPCVNARSLAEGGVSMIIAFGGDGTILHTARCSAGSGVPILGVNLGKVGFMAEIAPDRIDEIPGRLISGDYQVLERMAFDVTTGDGDGYFALNDIVLDRGADSRILDLTVSVNDEFAGEFSADGLIVSTPTGSTAHSLSAGGPLVMPECSVFVLTSICPHSLTMRPMIVDGSRTISVGVADGFARMAVDGQSFVSMPRGSKVVIRRAPEPVKIARFTGKTYFDILHTRLRWGVSLKLRNA